MEPQNLLVGPGQIMLRLLVATLMGAVIGIERERQHQPAGLRTHIILVVGSTLAMTISINIAAQFKPMGLSGDPTRLAAQVVSGIGFLGAGAILRFGTNVRGLTTATSLWTLAMIGLAAGAGYFFTAGAATLILLVVLSILDTLERRFIKGYVVVNLHVDITDRRGILDEVRQAITNRHTSVGELSIARDLSNDVASLDLSVKTREDAGIDQLVDNVMGLQGVKSYKIG